MNGDVLRILSTFIPLLVAASGVLVWAIRTRPANTSAEEQVAEGQWTRTLDWIAKLEGRIEVLERDLEACHHDRDEARADALKWKAVAEGIGQNRQDEATILAAQRLAEQEEKKGLGTKRGQ